MKLGLPGVVPKKAPGQYRTIYHLRYPPGHSVDDGILDVYTSVRYTDSWDTISHFKAIGSSVCMSKIDIEFALRNFLINPFCYHPMGIEWKGKIYYSRA